jgi:Icc-related predicted phosphoesterase
LLKGFDMTAIILVGDTHSDRDAWLRIFAEGTRLGVSQYLHVGDLNVWPYTDIFPKVNHRFLPTLLEALVEHRASLRFIRGNHDNLETLETWPEHGSGLRRYGSRIEYAPNGHRWVWGGRTFVALGGAYSTDEEAQRRQGIYSEREVVSEDDVELCRRAGQADVLVCHDAPVGYDIDAVFAKHGKQNNKHDSQTRANRERVQQVMEEVQPSLVVHGHYHVSGLGRIDGNAKPAVVSLGKNGELGGYALLELDTMTTTFLGSK